MYYQKNRSNLLPTIARTSPVLLVILSLLNCIVNPSYNSFFLLIVLILLFPINWIIKHLIVKPIYNLLGRKTLPILGSGTRPLNAISCGLSLDNIPAVSYGMPSGHSQLIWSVGSYLICKIIKKWIDTQDDVSTTAQYVLGLIWLITSCIVIFTSMVFVSYSRVYIDRCHTIQQVIIGGGIGVATGMGIFYSEDHVVNLLQGM